MDQDAPAPTPSEQKENQWLLLADVCRAQLALLPRGEWPEAAPLSPGDEWKADRYREAAEEEWLLPVLEVFEQWKATGQWPTMPPTVAGLVHDRLEWAARCATWFATPPHVDAAPTAFPKFPGGTVRLDAVLWLAVGLYDRYRPSDLKRWRDRRDWDSHLR